MPTVTHQPAASLPAGTPVHGAPVPGAWPGLWVVPHEAVCPWCRSEEVSIDTLNTGDGIEETAYVCENPDCGAVWPLACVCEWGMR
jgi:hypothetical protein